MKKVLSTLLVLTAVAAMFLGCTGSKAALISEREKITVGVIQYASHPSLDNCYQGVKEGLEASELAGKITIDMQNGNLDSSTCDTIAKNMAAKQYDIIIAIATPAAVSAYAAVKNTQIPLIYCAVSDPVATQLAKSLDAGLENCIGTSDILDLSAQLDLITTIQPDVKKIGVLYTTSEANSVSQLALLTELAGKRGLTIDAQGVQSAADIPQAAAALASRVDAINNFTDNNVVNNLNVLLEKANAAGVPVYGSEIEQVKNGCIAAVSIDYVALGKTTAEMAIEVMKGKDTTKMAVGQISEGIPVINTDVMAAFSFEIPEAYASAETVTTNK